MVRNSQVTSEELLATKAAVQKLVDALGEIQGVRCFECDGGESIIEDIRSALAAYNASKAEEKK